ncbi:hypothetical protein [Ereboglobus luteus]|nr:hypothetical protein [Ereboglobus luteus]
MQNVTCSRCGTPFKTVASAANETPPATHFCCAGCALLARVPVDEKGQFPVNAHLISALVTGFLYFNQLLFWLLTLLLEHQEKIARASQFCRAGAVAALAVWCAVAYIQWREQAARRADYCVSAIALGIHAWMIAGAIISGATPRAWPMAAANALLILWNARGVFRGKKSRR